MKTTTEIALEIVKLEKEDGFKKIWNGKFYTTTDAEGNPCTFIYVGDKKIDFTSNYELLPRDNKGFLYISVFARLVYNLRDPVMKEFYETNW